MICLLIWFFFRGRSTLFVFGFQTDVCGIRWVVYREQENPQTLDPAEDAILQSYAKCLEAELLAVWRRIPNRPTHDSGGGGGPGPGGTAAVKRCNKDGGKNLLTQRKELWVFWYGDKPPADADQQLLKRLVSPQLKEADISGTWENNGLPYEARTLLYKALNNLIERSDDTRFHIFLTLIHSEAFFCKPPRANVIGARKLDVKSRPSMEFFCITIRNFRFAETC